MSLPTRAKIGLNPLPWVLTARGFELTEPVLRGAFAEIATTGFRAIHADPPTTFTPEQYRELLAEYGLVPAPGYFSAAFHEVPRAELVESAKRHAATQAALGNTEVFIAAARDPGRFVEPAVGAGSDPDRLNRVVDGLGAAAEAITGEGVRPALHPHVGGPIEVEHEVRTVLDAIPASVLGFGPDTGHLGWAGMDPVAVMSAYANRIAAMHLKDVHLDAAAQARAEGRNYTDSTRGDLHVWTEPGRGDLDLVGALQALPATFAGWVIVEVDVPEAPTNLRSTELSAQWVVDEVGEAALTAHHPQVQA